MTLSRDRVTRVKEKHENKDKSLVCVFRTKDAKRNSKGHHHHRLLTIEFCHT